MRSSLIRFFVLTLFLLLALSSCAANGGILGGGNWQQSGLANQHIQTLAVDPNNAQNVYAGGANGVVFASADGGQHWTERDGGLPFPNAINQLAFDTTGKKLYAATAQGIFFSTDGAQQWSKLFGPSNAAIQQQFVALAFDPNNPHVIYLATSSNVYISRNDGTAWAMIASRPAADANIYNITYDSTRHQLWAATSIGIYRYDDSGSTWQRLNNGLPNGIKVYTVQPVENSGGDANLVFAGTSQGFFRSTDDGAHWMQSQQTLQRTEVRSLFVDFQQPTTVYAGTTSAGVLQSTDSGQTWSGLGPDFPYGQPVYAIQLGADNYTQLFAATNAVYIFPGSSGGLSFTRLLPLLLVFVFFFALIRFTSNRRRVNALVTKAKQQQQAAPVETPEHDQAGAKPVEPEQAKDTGASN